MKINLGRSFSSPFFDEMLSRYLVISIIYQNKYAFDFSFEDKFNCVLDVIYDYDPILVKRSIFLFNRVKRIYLEAIKIMPKIISLINKEKNKKLTYSNLIILQCIFGESKIFNNYSIVVRDYLTLGNLMLFNNKELKFINWISDYLNNKLFNASSEKILSG